MENHGTKTTHAKAVAAGVNDYHMRVEALHAAVAIQPKQTGAGDTNPSAGQLIADAEKILSYLKGE